MQIHIPQPCSESWNEMTPSAGGRFCARCAHTVVDFSGMSGEEIALYLQLNAGENLCGRFRADQLMVELPAPDEFVLRVIKAPLSLIRQIAAIIIFALFLSSAATADAQTRRQHSRKSTPEQPALTGLVTVPPPQVDTSHSKAVFVGEVVERVDTTQNEVLGRMPLHQAKEKAGKGSQRKPKDKPVKTSITRPQPNHLAGKIVPYLPPKK